MNASTATNHGTLYIVATPIGNLQDISQRAIDTLSSVDAVLAEDTRHSKSLLNALGLSKPIQSLHAHNEKSKSEQLIASLVAGRSFALVSDAGTPLISDPGFPLVQLAQQQNIPVVPIPGACAFVTALSAAGIPCDTFTFSGFLPAKKSARVNALNQLLPLNHTLVFYESTHRIIDCLEDMAEVFGKNTSLVIAKELTKTFERFVHGNASEIKTWLLQDPRHIKGEFVVMIPPRERQSDIDDSEALLKVLLEEVSVKVAAKLAVKLTGKSKNELYQLALKING